MVYWDDAGVYNVSGGCAAVPTLSPLTFTIDNTDYTLTPQQYILQVSIDWRFCMCRTAGLKRVTEACVWLSNQPNLWVKKKTGAVLEKVLLQT